uniref:LSM5 homolog, U6 small nuclear RNA and mRNA degradation associated n=1 Tax=Catharus ustulatus TaxID=91951 RepID=A0A8C3UPJ8_CATUS
MVRFVHRLASVISEVFSNLTASVMLEMAGPLQRTLHSPQPGAGALRAERAEKGGAERGRAERAERGGAERGRAERCRKGRGGPGPALPGCGRWRQPLARAGSDMAASAVSNPSQLLPLDMVLEDVTEFEITPEGRRITKLDQILLNGNNITMRFVRSMAANSAFNSSMLRL